VPTREHRRLRTARPFDGRFVTGFRPLDPTRLPLAESSREVEWFRTTADHRLEPQTVLMTTAVRQCLLGVVLMILPSLLLSNGVEAQHFPADEDLASMLRFLVEDRETTGIVLGVRDADGTARLLHFGSAGSEALPLDPRSVFEIGSVTKTFAATLLADMVLRGEVGLEDPVARYLPEHVTVPSRGGRAITLRDLATHTSGLPRLPDNLRLGSPRGPYADYTVERLYEFLASHDLRRAPGEAYEYSNVGYGLLAHALALAAGTSFRDLLRERVLEPLGMDMTGYALERDAAEWMVQSHRFGMPVPPLEVAEAMEGAGGLRSSAADMLRFLEANAGPPRTPLERAMRQAHQVQVPDEATGAGQGLAWRTVASPDGSRIVGHGGSTPGSQARLHFIPERGVGAFVLANEGQFRDALALNLLQHGAPFSTWERVAVAPGVLAQYVGEYEEEAGHSRFNVRLEEEEYLTFHAGAQVRARLYATSDSTFHLLRFPWSLTFRAVDDGRGMELRLEVDERHPAQQGLTRSARRVVANPRPRRSVAHAAGFTFHVHTCRGGTVHIVPTVVLVLSLALTTGARAQEAQTYTFRLLVGDDTIASDVVHRTPVNLEIDLVALNAGMRTMVTMTLAGDERVTSATQRNYPLGATDTVAVYSLVMEFAGDSVRGELTRPGRGTQTTVLPTRSGAALHLDASSATVEQVLRRARAMGGETVTVPVLDLSTARTAPAVVRWAAADSAVVTYSDLEVHATVGEDGALLEYTVPSLGARAIRLEGAHPLIPGDTTF